MGVVDHHVKASGHFHRFEPTGHRRHRGQGRGNRGFLRPEEESQFGYHQHVGNREPPAYGDLESATAPCDLHPLAFDRRVGAVGRHLHNLQSRGGSPISLEPASLIVDHDYGFVGKRQAEKSVLRCCVLLHGGVVVQVLPSKVGEGHSGKSGAVHPVLGQGMGGHLSHHAFDSFARPGGKASLELRRLRRGTYAGKCPDRL